MSKPVLFFHVQHLLGIGHQMRAAALARACMAAGFEVHYASGGFDNHAMDLAGARYHQLPPVRVRGNDFNCLEDEAGYLIDEGWWERRREATLDLCREIQPDLLLLEGYPFARRKFGRELLPVIDLARQRGVPVATSIRDILVPPSKDKKRLAALEIAEKKIDLVLVHGDPAFISLQASLEGAETLAGKTFYSGYVDGGKAAAMPTDGLRNNEIVVSVGGGAVGAGLLKAAAGAARILKARDVRWRLLAGPNLPAEAVTAIEADIAGLDAILEPARPDFRALLCKARLSVSQAGYNTVMDLMAARCPALLIPFSEGGESEQPQRADLLGRAGLTRQLAEADCTAENLADAVADLLDDPLDPASVPFPMDGAARSANRLLDLAGGSNDADRWKT